MKKGLTGSAAACTHAHAGARARTHTQSRSEGKEICSRFMFACLYLMKTDMI